MKLGKSYGFLLLLFPILSNSQPIKENAYGLDEKLDSLSRRLYDIGMDDNNKVYQSADLEIVISNEELKKEPAHSIVYQIQDPMHAKDEYAFMEFYTIQILYCKQYDFLANLPDWLRQLMQPGYLGD